jgi:predicted transcriptional regulator YdeE
MPTRIGSPTPNGWTKWVIPAFEYATAPCTPETYQETLRRMLGEYLPQNGYALAGSVQKFYDPRSTRGELVLFVPIERL